MGRCCVVNNCLMGRKVQNSKSILNLGKISLFKVPKKPDLAKRWAEAIGRELTSRNYVCHLHFDPTDILKEDNIKLPGGEIYSSNRSRFTLKSNAIPQLNLNQCSNNTNCDNDISSNINCVARVDNEVDITLNQDDNSLYTHSTAYNSKNGNSTEIDNFPQNNLLTKDPVDECIFLNNASDNGDVANVNNGVNSPNKVVDSTFEIYKTEYLTVYDIHDALRTKPLPRNWSWTSDHEKSIILSYLDSTCWQLKCHLKINHDLAVTVINAYTNVCIDVNVIISEIETVWNLLSEVQNYYFCCGTGYDEVRCSSTCEGIVLPNDYKQKMAQYRCAFCRQARQNIQNRNNEKIGNDSQGLYANKQIQLNSEKRKISRLGEKVFQLQIQLNSAKRRIIRLGETLPNDTDNWQRYETVGGVLKIENETVSENGRDDHIDLSESEWRTREKNNLNSEIKLEDDTEQPTSSKSTEQTISNECFSETVVIKQENDTEIEHIYLPEYQPYPGSFRFSSV